MYVIGVDVGTVSVRLAIFQVFKDAPDHKIQIQLVDSEKQPISHRQISDNRFEQNSEEIWQAICDCCKRCLTRSGIDHGLVRSISFSATCSLVVVNSSKSTDQTSNNYDIIMWMDHRAIDEARSITESGHPVLRRQFGGVCSPEFSLAKIHWLAKNEPERYKCASEFFELPDWLVYRCLGAQSSKCPRSLCSMVCKWGFDMDSTHEDNISLICGFGRYLENSDRWHFPVLEPGTNSGCLGDQAAQELGLSLNGQEIILATSLIDAHSGMLAMLSTLGKITDDIDIESTVCSLMGTSSCHLILSKSANQTHGIWGPYKNVIIQDYYLLEAGQSVTGKLIELCIESNSQGKLRLSSGEPVYSIIADLNQELSKDNSNRVANSLQVLPFHHGNRSPLSNSQLKGAIYGLSMDGEPKLVDIYAATVHALAYENKLIFDAMALKPKCVIVTGGLTKNDYFIRTLATVLNCSILKIDAGDIDLMVMGSSLLAANVALDPSPMTEIKMKDFHFGKLNYSIQTPDESRLEYHNKRYQVFKMFVDFAKYAFEHLEGETK